VGGGVLVLEYSNARTIVRPGKRLLLAHTIHNCKICLADVHGMWARRVPGTQDMTGFDDWDTYCSTACSGACEMLSAAQYYRRARTAVLIRYFPCQTQGPKFFQAIQWRTVRHLSSTNMYFRCSSSQVLQTRLLAVLQLSNDPFLERLL